MNLRFWSLLLFIVLSLTAQSMTWSEKADSASAYLELNPEDDTARLNLGYYYMMSHKPLLALREYRRITQRDSDNLDAWSGVIWAYNGMHQYKLARSTAQELVSLHREHAPFYNLLASAYLRLGDHTAARYNYSLALEHSPLDRSVRRAAYEGLGWSYYYLGDPNRSRDNFLKARSLIPAGEQVYGMDLIERSNWQTEFAWTRPSSDANAYFASQSYSRGSWGLQAMIDEFQRDGKHYRTALQFQAHKQIGMIRSRASAQLLVGVDAESYPAQGLGVGNNAAVHIRTMALTPFHRFHLMHYPRFDVYQNDTGISINHAKADIGYQFTHLYQDNDALGSDEQRTQHHIWLGYPIGSAGRLGFYAGWGDQSWWTTPAGASVDTYYGVDSYYGFDLFFPLAGGIYAGFYNQIGSGSSGWDYLFKVRLNFSY